MRAAGGEQAEETTDGPRICDMCSIHHPEGTQETPTEDMGADGAREREQARRMHRCEQRGVSRQRRQRLRLRMYDIRRWARSILERIYSLDGERVHPHPGMSPKTASQRQTASELAQR